MTGRSTLRLLGCALAAAVVLSGCSAKHQANESLPSPTSASSSTPALPPLGPKDLPMPAAARTKDASGAEAFVRYYIALINRTSTVMDPKPLRDFSQNCRDCNRIATDTEKDAALGRRYDGGETTITWIQALEPATTAQVAFAAKQAAMRVIDRTGSPVAGLTFDALPTANCGALLSWDSARRTWVISELTLG